MESDSETEYPVLVMLVVQTGSAPTISIVYAVRYDLLPTNLCYNFFLPIYFRNRLTVYAAKKYPLKFFAIFLATARNFYMKFHTFITHS